MQQTHADREALQRMIANALQPQELNPQFVVAVAIAATVGALAAAAIGWTMEAAGFLKGRAIQGGAALALASACGVGLRELGVDYIWYMLATGFIFTVGNSVGSTWRQAHVASSKKESKESVDAHTVVEGRRAEGSAVVAAEVTDHVDDRSAAKDTIDASGAYALGLEFDRGEGVIANPSEALKWYRVAALNGHAKAQHRLGRMHEVGDGTPPDEIEALRWYKMASAQGYSLAQEQVSRLTGATARAPKANADELTHIPEARASSTTSEDAGLSANSVHVDRGAPCEDASGSGPAANSPHLEASKQELNELRNELARLRSALAHERSIQEAANESTRLRREIEEARAALENLRKNTT